MAGVVPSSVLGRFSGAAWVRQGVPSAWSAGGGEGGVRVAAGVRPGGGRGVRADAVEEGGGLGGPALADLGVGQEVEVDAVAGVVLALPLQPPVEGGLHHLAGPPPRPVPGAPPGRPVRCPPRRGRGSARRGRRPGARRAASRPGPVRRPRRRSRTPRAAGPGRCRGGVSASCAVIRWWAWWCSGWRERTSSKSLPVSSPPSSRRRSRSSRPSQGVGSSGVSRGGGETGLAGRGCGRVLGAQGAYDGRRRPRRVAASALSGSASSQSRAQRRRTGISARTRTRCPRRSQSSPVVDQQGAGVGPAALGELARASTSSASSRAGSKAWSERPPRRRERPRGGGGGDMPQASFRRGVRADDRAQQSGRECSESRGGPLPTASSFSG